MAKWRKGMGRQRRWIKKQLIREYGAVCALCELPFETMKDITLDHVVLRSKGGLDEYSNLQLAHPGCNQDKGSMLPDEFRLWVLETA